MAKNLIIDVRQIESGGSEPVSLTEIKAQAIITYSDDDTLLTRYGILARRAVENFCNISIVSNTVTLTAILFTEWELPYGPVTGINSVKTGGVNEGSGPLSYSTASGGWNTDGLDFVTFIPAGANSFNTSSPFRGYFQWGRFASPYGVSGETRYQIVYTTGYSTVPQDLKQAVLLQCAYLYEHRGEEAAAGSQWAGNLCEDAKLLSEPYKRQAWL